MKLVQAQSVKQEDEHDFNNRQHDVMKAYRERERKTPDTLDGWRRFYGPVIQWKLTGPTARLRVVDKRKILAPTPWESNPSRPVRIQLL